MVNVVYKIWSLAAHSNLRGLAASPSSLSNDSFVFDGTNSDIAQQLYTRHRAGDSTDQVNLTSVPAAVIDRLDPLNIDFGELPGLVQRAVLWDSGFAIAPGNDPVQIWTLYKHSMADLALPVSDVLTVDCTMTNCSQPNNITAYSSQSCSSSQILNMVRCVADTFEDNGAGTYLGTFWANGGDPGGIPGLLLREHSWAESTAQNETVINSVYAVHTTPSADEAAWATCPTSGYASFTVPCQRRDAYRGDTAGLRVPKASAWVTKWLEEEFAHGFPLSLVIVIVVSAIAAIGIGAFCWHRRIQRVKQQSSTTSSEARLRPPAESVYEAAGTNETLHLLLNSEYLQGKRIPYESLVFDKALSKGAYGEVWLCDYNREKVAVKRLLQSKQQKADKVHAFAEEIELSASLVHPNIVEFIGVAWNSLSNLVMVLEFFPKGSLQNYLHQGGGQLSWASDKITLAIGIARALDYLHARTPPLIHRDLKSNNILLTEALGPKLIDFGVSRGKVDLTMTAGVGTPYWTAPEILESKRYDEKADVYSFGVVLSELDTCEIPFSDALTEDGSKAKPFQILQNVMKGTLQPRFSTDCPPVIRQIALSCLKLDPADRPTASQLIRDLESSDSK
ncbi:hypothetical protein PHYSODRAFT_337952 [Phytophthora sojae]|uniref:Protein kinase domain-containing protein n=1 Tax=Phytophthora sojae (strain P6497) TaxID=1094619 RepID=G4ZZK7_PHYSP|nr:hypothetical protein PHYSODRAFT_337952 [Phytophthora sojae]EGZ11207.1 hypothetical protein PHYSODRAFT_337952 [Phytophthora sojae]|eukprot:XP_009533952.1 hypothetical protein PHYSODRAFT_337952 [Phytophthora sojae]